MTVLILGMLDMSHGSDMNGMNDRTHAISILCFTTIFLSDNNIQWPISQYKKSFVFFPERYIQSSNYQKFDLPK